MTGCTIALAPAAVSQIYDIANPGDAQKILGRLKALQSFPEMGVIYEPRSEECKPNHGVYVTYVGDYGIFYVYDQALHLMGIEYVGKCRAE